MAEPPGRCGEGPARRNGRRGGREESSSSVCEVAPAPWEEKSVLMPRRMPWKRGGVPGSKVVSLAAIEVGGALAGGGDGCLSRKSHVQPLPGAPNVRFGGSDGTNFFHGDVS